jgi:hypothetical protein
MLIRYWDLVASYFSKEWNTKLIIRSRGMPWLPSESDESWRFLQKSWYDVVAPDYYGYARSGGVFTPSWCVQTVVDTANTFRSGIILDVRWNSELSVHYDEIVVVGSSFWWWVACMVPKFDTSIKEIVLLYPRFPRNDFATLWYKEETTEEYIRQCTLWYSWLMRFGDQEWWELLYNGEWTYAIEKEYEHLRDVSIFMGYGTADEIIHYSRTRDFYTQLQEWNPSGEYSYVEYYGLGHSGTCKTAIMEGRLRSKMQDKR